MRRGALYLVTLLLTLGWSADVRASCPFRQPVALPKIGDAWQIPPTWARRGLTYGTPSMVGLIQRTARRVAKERPGATLYVADLSRRKGGPSEWHLSHTCGRDVDLLFYALGPNGKQLPAPARMIPFDAKGVGRHGGHEVTFDTARNWALVKALLQDRVHVEKLFIHAALKKRLLSYARKRKESAALIARADARMVQPTNAGPHDDHLHVRVALTRQDIEPPKKTTVPAPAPVASPRRVKQR